jgi:methanogenic corrinoid protein MtbC1
MAGDEMMRQSVAVQLRSGARAFASAAAEELLESNPAIEERHGSGAFSMWQSFLTQRVTELATAVELDEPGLFTNELNWLYTTLSAREISPEDVRSAVACLGDSLEAELASRAWEVVRPSIEHAATSEPMGTEPASEVDTETQRLVERFLKATLGGDASAATGLVLGAFRDGMRAEDLFERVMLPVQAEIGILWQHGKLGIADEHVATELIRASMTALWLEATGGEISGPTVVVGSVTGDQHDTGVRAASYLMDICGLRSGGLRGICLGCDVPAEEFATAAARFEASAAVVSASMSVHLPRVKQTVAALKAGLPEIRVIVGGPAFSMGEEIASRLASKFGADAYARTPTAAAMLIGSAG